MKIGQMVFAYVLQESLVGLRPWASGDRHLLHGLFDALHRSRVEIISHDLDSLRRNIWVGWSRDGGWGAYCMNANLLTPSTRNPARLTVYYTDLLQRLLP
ncbi:MAG: hypothetical protein HY921_10740 [Elusimicrobia bacterium]|nr:hypothetical protein [Elusimicrobiota bacterium]